MLDAATVSAALVIPRRISDTSAWVAHIPFAFALMHLLRPRRVVELGTHKGDAYGAFCQAVEMFGLPTRCMAVDTWAGDASAGYYGPEVLAELRRHHDPLYAEFSTLRQSTFDAAAATVEDGSVDLLHIDGAHDYDAVRHDFETWRPRLSTSAVVLFHDTQVTTGGFGVHRVWEELRGTAPHFEFQHGYGLGILAVGRELPGAFRGFLEVAGEHPEAVRGFFAALGQRLDLSRAMGRIAGELKRQAEIANDLRAGIGAPPLPPFFASGNGHEALTAEDGKAWLDGLAWYAASITGDFAHAAGISGKGRGR